MTTVKIINRSASGRFITVEWDGVYGGAGDIVTADDGQQYEISSVVARGPYGDGKKFVTHARAQTPEGIAYDLEITRAKKLDSDRARDTDRY